MIYKLLLKTQKLQLIYVIILTFPISLKIQNHLETVCPKLKKLKLSRNIKLTKVHSCTTFLMFLEDNSYQFIAKQDLDALILDLLNWSQRRLRKLWLRDKYIWEILQKKAYTMTSMKINLFLSTYTIMPNLYPVPFKNLTYLLIWWIWES